MKFLLHYLLPKTNLIPPFLLQNRLSFLSSKVFYSRRQDLCSRHQPHFLVLKWLIISHIMWIFLFISACTTISNTISLAKICTFWHLFDVTQQIINIMCLFFPGKKVHLSQVDKTDSIFKTDFIKFTERKPTYQEIALVHNH